MKWIKPAAIDKERVHEVMQQFSLDALSTTLLMRRGLDKTEELLYLAENKEVLLRNPFLMPDIGVAIERISSAIEEQEMVMVVGDRDADGVTSTALMVGYLRSQGLAPSVRLPMGDEPFGLTNRVVHEAKAQMVTLIICVDNGSTCHQAVAEANANYMDVVIFDHHEVSVQELGAYAFVNPKRDEKYPNTRLSASVVVWKALFCLEFAQSGRLDRCDCLVHVSMIGNSMAVNLIHMVNFQATRRLNLLFDGKDDTVLKQRFVQFVAGSQLYVYQAAEQIRLLSEFFGADVYAVDLVDLLDSAYPSMSRMSLAQIYERSMMLRVQGSGEVSEALVLLYKVAILAERADFPAYNAGVGLAMIGLLADASPMLDENRVLVTLGLAQLNQGVAHPLHRLLGLLGLLGESLTAHDLNWRFIPIINAAGRMGQPDIALAALLESDEPLQQGYAAQLQELNTQRRALSEQWWESLYEVAKASLKEHDNKFIYLCVNDLPRGLTGLLAGRFARTFHAFVVLVAPQSVGSTASASLRSEVAGHVGPFIEYFRELFIDAGGHVCAGGFAMEQSNIAKLEQGLAHFVATLKEVEEPTDSCSYDALIPLAHFHTGLVTLVERFEPYGEGFSPFVFMVEGVTLEHFSLIGKQEEHVRLTFDNGGTKWQGVFWRGAEKMSHFKFLSSVDVVFTLKKEQGRFAGPKMNLIDIRRQGKDE